MHTNNELDELRLIGKLSTSSITFTWRNTNKQKKHGDAKYEND
jgi:ABC-type transporter Mla MlaB component